MNVLDEALALVNTPKPKNVLDEALQLVQSPIQGELTPQDRITQAMPNWGVRNISAAIAGAGGDVMALGQRAGIIEGNPDVTQGRANAIEAIQPDQGLLSRGARGAIRSLIPSAMGGIVGGPVGAIAAGGAIAGSQAVTAGRESGLSGAKLAGYVATQTALETVIAGIFQAKGLGGVESALGGKLLGKGLKGGAKEGAKTIARVIGQEIPEEELTSLGQAVADKVSGVDPNALTADSLYRTVLDTAVQSAMMGGAAATPSVIAQNVQAKLAQSRSASRKDMADALGLKPNELPPSLGSQAQREQALMASQQTFSVPPTTARPERPEGMPVPVAQQTEPLDIQGAGIALPREPVEGAYQPSQSAANFGNYQPPSQAPLIDTPFVRDVPGANINPRLPNTPSTVARLAGSTYVPPLQGQPAAADRIELVGTKAYAVGEGLPPTGGQGGAGLGGAFTVPVSPVPPPEMGDRGRPNIPTEVTPPAIPAPIGGNAAYQGYVQEPLTLEQMTIPQLELIAKKMKLKHSGSKRDMMNVIRKAQQEQAVVETPAPEVAPPPLSVKKGKKANKAKEVIPSGESVQEGQEDEGRQNAEVLGKQPWEMTRDEFDSSRAKTLGLTAEFRDENILHGGKFYPKEQKIWRQTKAKPGMFTHELRHAIAIKAEKNWNEFRNYDLSLEDAHKASRLLGIDRSFGYEGLEYRQEFKHELATRIAQGDKILAAEFPKLAAIVNQDPELLNPGVILRSHREIVSEALQKGEFVPPEVLAEYPDLQPPDAGTVFPAESPAVEPPPAPQGTAGGIQESNLALREWRTAMKKGGIRQPEGLTIEDLGGKFPPGIIRKKGAGAYSWDQALQEAERLGLVPKGSIDPSLLRDLFRGSSKMTIGEAKETPVSDFVRNKGRAVEVNETEMDVGDLVYHNGEWLRVNEKDDAGTVLQDGEPVRVENFDSIQSSKPIKSGEPGYEYALEEYRAQEAKKPKVAVPTSQQDELFTFKKEPSEDASTAKNLYGDKAVDVLKKQRDVLVQEGRSTAAVDAVISELGQGPTVGYDARAQTEQAPTQKKGKKSKTTVDIMKEADDNDMGTMQGGLGLALPGRVKVRGGKTTKQSRWPHPNPKAETGQTKNHGVHKDSWRRRIHNWFSTAIKYATRSEVHIDRSTKNSPAHELFRLLKEAPNIVGDRVHRTVAAIIDPLNEETIDLYERTLLWRNYAENLKRGEPMRNGITDPKRDVHDYLTYLESEVTKIPEVQKALDNRETAKQEILDELERHGLIKNADRDAYWHQQVLSKLQSDHIGTGGAKKKGRTFQHKRFQEEGVDTLPEEYDINTDYIEAETSWMTQAISEIEKAKFIENLDKLFGKRAEFAAEAKARKVDLSVVLRENPDYAPWAPNAKNIFYKAMSLPEKFRAMLEQQSLEDMVINGDLSKSDFHDVLAVTAREPALILPRQIVNQLESMETPKAQGQLGDVADDAMNAWKVWTLISPKRIAGYSLRNMFGDVDAAINVPGVFTKAPEAFNMLVDLHNNKLALPKAVQVAMRYGVIGGGLTSMDIPDTKTISVFKRFYASQGQDLVNPVGWWFEKARNFNTFRENALRLSAFLYFREQLGKGTLTNFGASNREAVREIERTLGKDAAAAHLARNLLGDYGNVTVMGSWLSKKLIPFWRWNEVNMTRYPNLIKNALTQKGVAGAAKTTGQIVLKESALKALYLSRIAAMYGLLQLWNNLKWPDEEDGLSNDDRANPHVILGKTGTGETVLLRNVSAFGDFMEWFGLGEAISLMREWKGGQIDNKYFGKEVGFSIFNKGLQGIRPDVRGGFEVVAGQTYYPDPFNPRPKARDEIAAGIVGMDDEYRAAKGAVLQEGSAARKNYMARFLGVADPRQNALYEMYSLRDKYLLQLGKPQEFRGGISKFKKVRDSLMNENRSAFDDAVREYAKTHTLKDFLNHLSKLDPIETKLNDVDEAKFEYKYLNESQREKLKVSRAYVSDLRDMAIMWLRDQPKDVLATMLKNAKQ